MRPGTMKMAETRSGLYHARTRTSRGGSPPRPIAVPSRVRVIIWSERWAPRAAAAFTAEVATSGSEASTMTWTSAAWRDRRWPKSGGMITPTLAVPSSMSRVSSRWLPVQYSTSKYWLFPMASRKLRASALPD